MHLCSVIQSYYTLRIICDNFRIKRVKKKKGKTVIPLYLQQDRKM